MTRNMRDVDIPPKPQISSTVHTEVTGLAVLFMPKKKDVRQKKLCSRED